MALIGQHQQTSFANPQNGQSPMDADTVRTNDNATVAKHNAHDNDATIHVQTGTLAGRPAASTVGALYSDENGRLYRDSGSAWVELPYARLDAAGTNAFTNNVTVGGTLGVTGTSTLGTTQTGALTTTTINATAITATSVNATLTGNGAGITGVTVAASGVSAGTFGAGNYTFPGNITSTSGEVLTRTLRVTRTTQSAAGGTANFANGNHHRITMTGNGTITLSGGAVGGIYTVEVVQDAVGGRTVAWSGATWAGGAAPTVTATANRKDVFTFFFDGTTYLGVPFGFNFASTA
jgi:hypothetical protein